MRDLNPQLTLTLVKMLAAQTVSSYSTAEQRPIVCTHLPVLEAECLLPAEEQINGTNKENFHLSFDDPYWCLHGAVFCRYLGLGGHRHFVRPK